MKLFNKQSNILFAALSGILLAASFPPLPFPLLSFVAFVPLLFILIRNENLRFKYMLIYLTFFIYHTGSNWWISSWAKETDPFLLISGLGLDIIHPLFFLFPFWLFSIVKRRLGADLALTSFPFIFVLFEWLHSLGDMAYPWLTIGNSQISNIYWIQFIEFTGIWGASFLILSVNTLLLKILTDFSKSGENKIITYVLKSRTASNKLILIALIIFLPYFYSFYALQKYDYAANLKKSKNITIALVQPNINPWLKWTASPTEQIILHQKLADSLLGIQNNIDLVLWSETAVPFVDLSMNSFDDLSILQSWIDRTNVSLLTGFSEFEYLPNDKPLPRWAKTFDPDTSQHYMTYNASVLLEPGKTYSSTEKPPTYRKSKLTPFGEHFPFKDVFPFLVEKLMWSVGISNWNIGTGADILRFKVGRNTAKIGNIICIESIHPNFVKDYIRKGANILTVITNDGWYDHTVGPRQHYLLSCIRAIENRRYIARVGNTGLSGFISPLGFSLDEVPQYTQQSKAMTLPLIETKTLYSMWGDWFAWLASVIALLFIIMSFIKKRNK
jgi:apolipoprotein N-acyltransferase